MAGLFNGQNVVAGGRAAALSPSELIQLGPAKISVAVNRIV